MTTDPVGTVPMGRIPAGTVPMGTDPAPVDPASVDSAPVTPGDTRPQPDLDRVRAIAQQAIADRFARAVDRHVVRNLQPEPPPGTAVILGVHGSPGTGKSYMVRRRLAEWGVRVVTLAGGDLEGAFAGDPAKVLRGHLRVASDHMAVEGHLAAALVIDDFDAGLGDWGDRVATTSNRQQLIADLMLYCDDPRAIGGRPGLRVPVFVTGNDLSRLYGPLRRSGRMELFHWEPGLEELAALALRLFPHLGPDGAVSLVSCEPGVSAAVLADLAGRLRDGRLDDLLDAVSAGTRTLHDVLEDVVDGRLGPERSSPPQAALEALLHDIATERRRIGDHTDLDL